MRTSPPPGRVAILLLACAALACAGDNAGGKLVLGPMIGHTTDVSTTIWLATTMPMPVEVKLKAPDGSEISAQGETAQIIEVGGATTSTISVGTVTVPGLKPRTTYAGQVTIDGDALRLVLNLTTFPAASQPTHLRLALGSAASVASDRQEWIWQAVADARPDALLVLGGSNFLLPGAVNDWDDPARMAFRFAELRGLASIQLLLRSIPYYALWDDRDYGSPDSSKAFPLKGDALRLFKAFTANPGYGSDKTEGIWSTFRYGKVQVILLDDRYWRDPDDKANGAGKTMLGAVQKAWLKRTLKASTARVKVIANGCQMLGSYTSFASFDKFPEERAELLAFLDQERIDGVVFVSGNRQLAELQKLERPGAYPLYDLTTAPMAAPMTAAGVQEVNPIRINSTTRSTNFAMLDIDDSVQPGTLTFRVNDNQGTQLFTRTVKIDELRYPAKP
jgi:alkaline phosphatase D